MSFADERPLSLSDNLLQRLHIPPNKKERFCTSVHAVVGNILRQPERRLRAAQITSPLKRIADLSNRLARALATAIEGQGDDAWAVHEALVHELRHALDRPQLLRQSENIDLVETVQHVASFLGDASTRAAESARKNFEARGGKPGIKGHSGVLALIKMLVSRILRTGGQISTVKKGNDQLIALLEELRQYLPPSFLPKRHPISRYNRCIEKAIEEHNRLQYVKQQ